MQSSYNKTAIKIFNNQIATALATIEYLKKLYLNEESH